MRPTAVVMNMFYTGLGIARSLGEHGVRVIGLSASRGVYGNFSRYAEISRSPDSRSEPEPLRDHLVRLGQRIGRRGILFPTRDDDVLFLDRFREELEPYFDLVIPERSALSACLNKWETHLSAVRAEVATPRCWLAESAQDLAGIAGEVAYPCVLKPVASYDWHRSGNWELVGGRKAVGVFSREELLSEYAAISRADGRVLVQEMVPGGDDCLFIAACYLDRNSRLVAGFNTRKLAQSPEGFGTGFIVQAVDRPELFEPTVRLLREIRFTGIAEVEYKWDAARAGYSLIEINPRPWDQHRLGKTCGADLVWLAYSEHAGLPLPAAEVRSSGVTWIAEDTFAMETLRSIARRDGKLRGLLQRASGRRIYAIWSARDPLPFLAYLVARFIPALAAIGARAIWSACKRMLPGRASKQREGLVHEARLQQGKSH